MDISYQTLPAVPSLGSLYARAAARTARLMLARPPAGAALPTTGYAAAGLQADAVTLSEYQHLFGEPGTDVLPAGYIHVLVFPLAMAVMVRSDFPLPVLGTVHVANRVVQHRPVLLGEELAARAHAENPRWHRRGTLLDFVVTVTAGGEVVWEGVSTYLSPGRRLAGGTPDNGVPSSDGQLTDPSTSRAGDGSTGTDSDRTDPPTGPPVTAPPASVWRLGRDVATRYAAVSGDRNPIHTSRLGAKLFGFPRPIAHGMYTAARALAEVGARRSGAFSWDVEFAKPVLLPTQVALTITPDGGSPHPAGTPATGAAASRPEALAYTGRGLRSGKLHFSGAVTPR